MTPAIEEKPIHVVIMGEINIHKKYKSSHDFLYDSDGERNVEVKAIYNGRYCCFIAAIIEEDQRQSSIAREEKPEAAKLIS